MGKSMSTKEKILDDFHAIFADYLIDTNRLWMFDSPEFKTESFYNLKKWEVAKIDINDETYLILDLSWLTFSYAKYVRCNKRIIKRGMDAETAFENLLAYSKMLGIPILNQAGYYMTKVVKGFAYKE
jgi:hypothetical protein